MEEVDPLIDNGDNNLGTMEFDVDNEVADVVTSDPLSLPSETLPLLPSPPARSFCDL